MKYTYTVILRRDAEGQYTVFVPALPGCLTEGEDISEAVSMAKDAMECYLGALLKQGLPIPEDSNTITFDRDDMVEGLVLRVSAEVEAEAAAYA
jgi:antitoxin HicB